MSHDENEKGAERGRPKRSKITLGLKIALGLMGEAELTEDEAEQSLFDLGFELGYDDVPTLIPVFRGMIAGLEQLVEDSAANDNRQTSLDV